MRSHPTHLYYLLIASCYMHFLCPIHLTDILDERYVVKTIWIIKYQQIICSVIANYDTFECANHQEDKSSWFCP